MARSVLVLNGPSLDRFDRRCPQPFGTPLAAGVDLVRTGHPDARTGTGAGR